MYIVTYLLILLSLGALSGAQKTFNCTDQIQIVSGDRGYLLVNRTIGSCVVMAEPEAKFFGFKTDNLKLYDGESVLATPGKESQKERNITGPVDTDYFVFGMVSVRIEFKLNHKDNSTMMLEFFQNQDSIPISGDRASETTIMSFGADHYSLNFSKNVKDSVYLQVIGSDDSFGHYLIAENKQVILVKETSNNTVVVKTSHVRQDCSKSYADKSEESHEISGPDASTIHGKYTCVNLFETSQVGQAHFDVDFANFLDIVDDRDELIIDDGIQALKINRYTAEQYYQLKPTLSFKGQKLAVIYDSPQAIKPRAVFKLTVSAKTSGGVIDTYGQLTLPTSGKARFTLRSPGIDSISGLTIKGKLTGANLTLFDNQNNYISLNSESFPLPMIAFNQASGDVVAEFALNSKVTSTISYGQANNCSGTIFGSSGTISINGVVNQTCYWLIGSKSTISIDYHNLQQPESCLEIYSPSQEKPIYQRCNIEPTEFLPPFTLGPAYLVVKTASNDSRLDASISKAIVGLVKSSKSLQTTYKSTGYPSFYAWSAFSDGFMIDARNKSMILSVADLDIRAGEKLKINSNEISNKTFLAMEDLNISDKVSNINVTRSIATSDFSNHKGYSLVVTQYHTIISANMNKPSIQTPKNVTSLLVRIAAAPTARLAYTIQGNNSKNQNYVMNVIDARSVVGRKVYDEEKLNGSTTSNVLLISVVTTQANKALPDFTIAYSQLACNQSTDHVCDQSTRCVPADKLCKGKSYCMDGTDMKVACSSGPAPNPEYIKTGGFSGFSMFFVSLLMFSLGIMAAIYGPDMYKSVENRFRSGQYMTFTSTE